MRNWNHCVGGLAICVFCSGSSAAEMVPNPAYVAWSKVKPGSSITFVQKMESSAQAAANRSQIVVLTLLEIKPDEAVIEVKTTPLEGPQEAENVIKGSVAAKVEAGKEYLATNTPPQRVEVKDMKEGKEVVVINGNKLDTVTHELTQSSIGPGPGITMQVKVWNCPEIPGGMVKEEQTGKAGPMGDVKITMTATGYTVKK